MDTDELSREGYEGVLLEAEKLNHDLTLHYGLLSGFCEDEADYIDKAIELTNEIMQAIIVNIESIRKIPIEKRHYDYSGD